jgi:hypothetical protein
MDSTSACHRPRRTRERKRLRVGFSFLACRDKDRPRLGGSAPTDLRRLEFGRTELRDAHGTATRRRQAYGARVYVCLTGDRGCCRNAGEDDSILSQARLIRRSGEISGALRRRYGYNSGTVGSVGTERDRVWLSRVGAPGLAPGRLPLKGGFWLTLSLRTRPTVD